MNKLMMLTVCLAGLWLSTGTVHAQYSPYNLGRFQYPGGGARLSPYLNLANGGDPAINYFSGTLPEVERRYNQSIFNTRIRGLETRQRDLINLANRGEDIIPPVPIAGAPIGSRSSASYFRQDGLGTGTNRSPRIR
jgi:hypothetical protein